MESAFWGARASGLEGSFEALKRILEFREFAYYE